MAPAMYQDGYCILAINMLDGTCIKMYPTMVERDQRLAMKGALIPSSP
jgi:hypothetical protein